jgi:hypothetical protein
LKKDVVTSGQLFAEKLQKHIEKSRDAAASRLLGAPTPSQEQEADALAAFFLGPKAENEKLFALLVEGAIRAHCDLRREYFPEDPLYVTEAMKNTPQYINGVASFKRELETLLRDLRGSVPFFQLPLSGPHELGYDDARHARLYRGNAVQSE